MIISWIKGYFKSRKEYYPTILFVVIGNMSYELLLLGKPLWEYTDIFGQYMIARILMMFVLYSGTVILYLACFPEKLKAAIAYVVVWTFLYTIIEGISLLLNVFGHLNGWNLIYTVIHNVIMFLLMILHTKKPLLAWSASLICAIATILLFNAPFAS